MGENSRFLRLDILQGVDKVWHKQLPYNVKEKQTFHGDKHYYRSQYLL